MDRISCITYGITLAISACLWVLTQPGILLHGAEGTPSVSITPTGRHEPASMQAFAALAHRNNTPRKQLGIVFLF